MSKPPSMEIVAVAAVTLIAAAISYLAGRRDERTQRNRELDRLLERQ